VRAERGSPGLRRARAFLRRLGGSHTRAVPQHARVRDLFLRVLGVLFLVAFLSLTAQIPVLFGSHGLLPAAPFLDAIRGSVSFWRLPTLFWLDASDATLELAGIAGTAASVALALGFWPRASLVTVWVLYLSFISVGQSFLAFQWDSLLLESAVVALAVAPAGLWPRRAPQPQPLAVLLVLWLAFRLHFESGVTKLASGDETWRDLTAMVSYYETAPIPTRLAWYVHQAPLWFHRLTSFVTLAVEIGLPFAFFVPVRRLRAAVFVFVLGFQATIFLTANYGFFNPLSASLAILLLDDDHLAWLRAKLRLRPRPSPPLRRPELRHTAATLAFTGAFVLLSLVPFLARLGSSSARWIERRWGGFRTINSYQLFTSMTLVRKEAVLEGSQDGETWESYELRYKPGHVDRPPPFVAPHQPRVDFLCWFLLLGGHDQEFFQTLVKRVATEPETVAGLFARMPFDGKAPRWLRVRIYEYHFTDRATRAQTGAWWSRELVDTSNVIDGAQFSRESGR
jgi:hypothetical protein